MRWAGDEDLGEQDNQSLQQENDTSEPLHNRKHSNQHDDIVNKKSFDKILNNERMRKDVDDIDIAEKRGIIIEDIGQIKPFNPKEESKHSSNRNKKSKDYQSINVGNKNYNLVDLMVLRPESVSNKEVTDKSLNNLDNEEIKNSFQIKKYLNEPSDGEADNEEKNSLHSNENNNLDLNSVR